MPISRFGGYASIITPTTQNPIAPPVYLTFEGEQLTFGGKVLTQDKPFTGALHLTEGSGISLDEDSGNYVISGV